MTFPVNGPREPPYKSAGLVLMLIAAVTVTALWMQFRGDFTPRTQLTMVADRAGLSMYVGSKVTYNGVRIGRVASTEAVNVDGRAKVKFTLDVEPQYVKLIPANVDAQIGATTLFGNKYVSLSSPKNPVTQRISSGDVIWVRSVTTEFNTLFETVVAISEKVDPVRLNETLSATAQALDGLGDRFGQSIGNGNEILDDLNPRMTRIRYDLQGLTALTDVYSDASPDLWNSLRDAVTTARTFNTQMSHADAALMSAVGFGNTGADLFDRAGPYNVRLQADAVPLTALLDEYSPEILCTIRNFSDLRQKFEGIAGGNGYSIITHTEFLGAPNPYVYPDNLPRINARGGPEGRPGCWQPITRDLWPAPYLVLDTGASIAPYNHVEIGSPNAIDYLWGRQIGENTINP